MKSLNKDQIDTLEEGITELRSRREELANALYDYNDAVRKAHDTLTEYIDAYNEKVAEMREFCEEVVDKISDYMGEHSDEWLDTETGEAVTEWYNQWRDIDMNDFPYPDEPEEISGDYELAHPDDLEGLSHAIQRD